MERGSICAPSSYSTSVADCCWATVKGQGAGGWQISSVTQARPEPRPCLTVSRRSVFVVLKSSIVLDTTRVYAYLGVHVCVHACVHVCMPACVHVFACTHACMPVCARVCVHVCTCACLPVCASVCMHMCVRVCARVCAVGAQQLWQHRRVLPPLTWPGAWRTAVRAALGACPTRSPRPRRERVPLRPERGLGRGLSPPCSTGMSCIVFMDVVFSIRFSALD